MRTSQYFLATLREAPSDAELISHQLMLRAGLIRKLASGLYSWLPLGFRVLHNVETIVREEMNRAGALEILLPAVQPKELWDESGRWDQYGNELLKINDRHQREFCFGPTHEEVITDIVRNDFRSYKQLPRNLYQIQTKFRDEIRPRFGVMRAREFLMKDAYSFHLSKDCLRKTYDMMYDAYMRIFKRLGLNFRPVLADTGSIGGELSHEFQVLAKSGEDAIFYSDTSDYAANVELAEAVALNPDKNEKQLPLEEVITPGKKSTVDVSQFLNVPEYKTVKTLLVKGTETAAVGLLLRGDHTLNTHKAEKHPAVAAPLHLLSEAEINTLSECPAGFIGPIDLNFPLLVDRSAATLKNFVCGANLVDKHFKQVNWERDLATPEIVDLRNVEIGDPSPDGQGTLQMARGIEVGHIFQLGDKYSKALNATVLNEKGSAVHLQMGCYGLGISRIVAAAIEQHHDEKGIIWPEPIAPFQVALIPINLQKSYRVQETCDALYQKLTEAGIDVLYDDRHERPGVMFADMDLLGIPHQVIISEKHIDAGEIEYKNRAKQEKKMLTEAQLFERLQK